jgi:hypothetical protein
MNKFILFLILTILTSCGITKLNLKADKFSYRDNVNGEWTTFSDWQPIDIKVKLKKSPFNVVKGKFIIYDKSKLTLKIVEENEESKTDNGERIISYNCVDNDGAKCYLILIDKGKSVNAIVYYTNLNLCYNLIETK